MGLMETHVLPQQPRSLDDLSYEAATQRAQNLIAHLNDLARQAGEQAVKDHFAGRERTS